MKNCTKKFLLITLILIAVNLSCATTTPGFHTSILENDTKTFEEGLKKKKNINLVYGEKSSLDLALLENNYDFVKQLLEKGAIVDSNYISLLIVDENIKMLRIFIECGQKPSIDDIKNYLSQNDNENAEILELLKSSGVGYPEIYQEIFDDAYINKNSKIVARIKKMGIEGPSETAIAKEKEKIATQREEARLKREEARLEREEARRMARKNNISNSCVKRYQDNMNCYKDGRYMKCSRYSYSHGMRYYEGYHFYCSKGKAYMKAYNESNRQAVRWERFDDCCY